jgi:hypothetical protein
MSNLPTKTEKSPKEEYNNIPVHYCKECLSLKVMRVGGMEEACYCDDCGCTDIKQTSIEEWEQLYRKKHGFTYLNSTY